MSKVEMQTREALWDIDSIDRCNDNIRMQMAQGRYHPVVSRLVSLAQRCLIYANWLLSHEGE